jgi:hypothetical protein
MTIRIYDNKIEFDSYTILVTENGLSIIDKNTKTPASFTTIQAKLVNMPFEGSVAGFASGGYSAPVAYNNIDRFLFSTLFSTTDVGDLTQSRGLCSAQSSRTHGYTSGGYFPPGTGSNVIDKFPFVTLTNATDVGDLTSARYVTAGQSSNTSGYASGSFPISSDIQKFPFAADFNATSVGTLTQSRVYSGGHSSITHGYSSGGSTAASGPTRVNTIDKFPFSADGASSDVGDLTGNYALFAAHSSIYHGYSSGGSWPNSQSTQIERFSFITDINSYSVGNLAVGRYGAAGHSYVSHGITSGGFTSPPQIAQTVIDRFPFAAGGDGSTSFGVGDLTVARGYLAGQQY